MPSPSGSTPIFGFPYPLETDIPDVATFGEDLALAIETEFVPFAGSTTPAWTSFTPTWVSTSGGQSVGNGVLTGFYKKIGRQVAVRINLTAGSTTNHGGGTYTFALPFASAASVGQFLLAYFNDLSNGWMGLAIIGPSGTTLQPYTNSGGSSGDLQVFGAGQFSTTGQVIQIQGVYESAT